MKKMILLLMIGMSCGWINAMAKPAQLEREVLNGKKDSLREKMTVCPPKQLLTLELLYDSWGGGSRYDVSVQKDGQFRMLYHLNQPIGPEHHEPGTHLEFSGKTSQKDLSHLLSLFVRAKFFELPDENSGSLHHSEGELSEKLVFCHPKNGSSKMVHGQLTHEGNPYQKLIKELQAFFKEQVIAHLKE